MLLNNVTLVTEHEPASIHISGEKILSVAAANTTIAFDNINLQFTDAIAFPGLINSHDHLDFNCFSPLGNKIYNNYKEWGNYIHANYKQDIAAVLKIPLHLRVGWGMYKNLLAGVTTVVNHGDFLPIETPLINILQEVQSLHSVKFQKKWKWKLNNPFLKNKLCVIHTGEGSDTQSAAEIDKLLQWNLFKRKLIGVHGIAMNPEQAKKFEGLVWCPESNNVLLKKHADIAELKANTRIVFGTDSTLTGNWNAWHHIRFAKTLKLVGDEELFSMITKSPAQLWNLPTGQIQAGKDADIVIAKTKNGNAGWDDFFSVNPENILMVLQKGKIRMFDEILFNQISSKYVDRKKYSCVNINSATKFVEGDVPALINGIKKYNPAVTLPFEAY
ncbi:MAG: amidohydrolase family protein [Bacteroidota bacterium]